MARVPQLGSVIPTGADEHTASQAWFKVYVVLTTGNEKGSKAVKITRP